MTQHSLDDIVCSFCTFISHSTKFSLFWEGCLLIYISSSGHPYWVLWRIRVWNLCEKKGGFLLGKLVLLLLKFVKYIYVCFIHCSFGCCANVLSLLNGKDFSRSLLVMWALGKDLIHREYLNNASTWMWQNFVFIVQKSVSFESEHALCWSL